MQQDESMKEMKKEIDTMKAQLAKQGMEILEKLRKENKIA